LGEQPRLPSKSCKILNAADARILRCGNGAGSVWNIETLIDGWSGARQRSARLRDCAPTGARNSGTTEETMNINRRELALPALAIGSLGLGLLGAVPALAASADEEAVAKNVEAFRKAQVAADAEVLATLCAAELSYSHSSGKVEDKATFIANATDGKSKFLSLEYQDPSIRVVGPAAIVRFHWVGEQEAVADGKKSSTNLHILMNWQKQGADWKLLSRASTKL
jgi:ketosteroid isomerase-like protein